MDGPLGWKELASGGAAIVAGLISYIVHGHGERMKMMDTKIDTKADAVELDRQRENIIKVFDGLNAIKDTLHANHAEVLRELGKKADR